MTVAPTLDRPRPGRTAVPAAGLDRSALAGAPPGGYPLLEVALAFYQLRPTGTGAGWAQGRPVQHDGAWYTLLVQAAPADVAHRLERLLGPAASVPHDGSGPLRDVLVPGHSYHRVLRALTTAWRHARPAPGRGGGPDPAGAADLWRMGLLLATTDGSGLRLALRPTPAAMAGRLASSARTLGAAAAVTRGRGAPAVGLDPAAVRTVAAAVTAQAVVTG